MQITYVKNMDHYRPSFRNQKAAKHIETISIFKLDQFCTSTCSISRLFDLDSHPPKLTILELFIRIFQNSYLELYADVLTVLNVHSIKKLIIIFIFRALQIYNRS